MNSSKSNDSYAGSFSHSIKIRRWVEYVYVDFWEYVFIVKV